VSTTSIEPLYAELEHFLQCVRGRETPAVDGLQASRALKLADLIEQAVEHPDTGAPCAHRSEGFQWGYTSPCSSASSRNAVTCQRRQSPGEDR